MLERVTLNQAGFKLPGVAPDMRGVLLGRYGVAILPTFDRLVSFLSVLSQEISLDDIIPSLKIYQVATELDVQEYLLFLTGENSYQFDRYARAVRFCDGNFFTGSGKHYVRYRDHASPLGYDIDVLSPENGEFVFYEEGRSFSPRKTREISFSEIVFQLRIKKAAPSLQAPMAGEPDLEDGVWLKVRPGLGPATLHYLWRHRINALASVIGKGTLPPPVPSGDAGGPLLRSSTLGNKISEEYLLLKITRLPQRVFRLLESVPGITLYRSLGANVLIEWGYFHPIRIESCSVAFDKDKFHVLSAGETPYESYPSLPSLVTIESLLQTHFDLLPTQAAPAPIRLPGPTTATTSPDFQVPLRLIQDTPRFASITATLIRWTRARLLRKLVYAMPAPILGDCKVASLPDGLFIISPHGLESLPIGDFYQEVAPSIFIPAGMSLSPRVRPEILIDYIGGTPGSYVILTKGVADDIRAIALGPDHFEPLGRRALAPIATAVGQRSPDMPAPRPPPEFELQNDPAGVFPLWGYKADPSQG
jgi:hypothetical protein